MEKLGENVKTNIPPSKFASFIKLYTELKNKNIKHLVLEGYDRYIDGVYYYVPSEESITEVSSILRSTLDSSTYTAEDHSSQANHVTNEHQNNW